MFMRFEQNWTRIINCRSLLTKPTFYELEFGVNVERTFGLGLKMVWKYNSLNFCDQRKIQFSISVVRKNFQF